MKPTTPIQIVRQFHRWSGIILIPLISLKILSGFNAAGNITLLPTSLSYQIHYAVLIDILLLFLFIGHALYGIYKIIQPKVKNKVLVFVWMNVIGMFIFIIALLFIYFV